VQLTPTSSLSWGRHFARRLDALHIGFA